MTGDPFDVLVRLLGHLAPEIDRGRLRPDVAWHDLDDFDSMDFLDLMSALYEDSGIDVPEHDYPQLATVGGFVDYVGSHLGTAEA